MVCSIEVVRTNQTFSFLVWLRSTENMEPIYLGNVKGEGKIQMVPPIDASEIPWVSLASTSAPERRRNYIQNVLKTNLTMATRRGGHLQHFHGVGARRSGPPPERSASRPAGGAHAEAGRTLLARGPRLPRLAVRRRPVRSRPPSPSQISPPLCRSDLAFIPSQAIAGRADPGDPLRPP